MSEVTPKEFQRRVLVAFDTMWAGRTPIAVQNEPFDPAKVAGDTWVRVFLLGEPGGQSRLTRSTARTNFLISGTLTVEVYARARTGLDAAYDLAQEIIRWMAKPGVAAAWFVNQSPPQELGDVGGWFQLSVSCNWRYLSDVAAA